MSKRYEAYTVVEGPIRLPVSTQVGLSPEQLAPRAHEVTIVHPAKGGGPALVSADKPLEFKTGEVIYLAERPDYLSTKIAREGEERGAAGKKAGADQKKDGAGGEQKKDGAGGEQKQDGQAK